MPVNYEAGTDSVLKGEYSVLKGNRGELAGWPESVDERAKYSDLPDVVLSIFVQHNCCC